MKKVMQVRRTPLRSCGRTGSLVRRLERFRKEEDGSLIVFGLFLFVAMLMLAGLAIDIMRFEERRTLLNNTADRAVLAATDLGQTLDARAVVKDYFVKAGLTPPTDDEIEVVNSASGSSRKVRIDIHDTMPTWFMKLAGVPTLSAPTVSAAEEAIGALEISLILDTSGSMNSSNRLVNLKPAANAFIDTIFDSSPNQAISVSVINYSTQVATSDYIIDRLPNTEEHDYSNCIDFDPAQNDYATTALSFDTSAGARVYKRSGHFDWWGSNFPAISRHCGVGDNDKILAFSTDRNEIKNHISGLSARGNTSINIGLKWGAAMIDPSMQPIVTEMIADGLRPTSVAGRPRAYDEDETLKIVVLMTDGANTTHYRLLEDFDHGPSRLFRNRAYTTNADPLDDYVIEQFSLYDADINQYYIFAMDATGAAPIGWRDKPWGEVAGDPGYNPSSSPVVQMTWPEVWDAMSVNYVASNFIAPVYGTTEAALWRPSRNSKTVVPFSTYNEKQQQTLAMCDALKAQSPRLMLYTIAFEAPQAGIDLMSACQNAGFFNVEGLDIRDAFAGIAASINKLRLTH